MGALMKDILAAGLLASICMLGLATILALPIQLLWNDLMPNLFRLNTITVWQAFKLEILISILFRSTGGDSK